MRSAIICLLLVSILLFSACSKNDNEKVYKLNPDGMRYIQLRQGQYFIYKDSASGTTDSVVVTQSLLTEEHLDASSSGNRSWFRETPQSGRREVYYLSLTRKGGISDSIWLTGEARGNITNNVRFGRGNSIVFYYPSSSPLTSLDVEGKTYNNVIIEKDVVWGDFAYIMYWAPNVGLIKIIKSDGSFPWTNRLNTYTLLRHN